MAFQIYQHESKLQKCNGNALSHLRSASCDVLDYVDACIKEEMEYFSALNKVYLTSSLGSKQTYTKTQT